MDNKRNKVSFEYDITDLPMIAAAFAVARNRALLCGNRKAQDRFEQLRQQIDALIPETAKIFKPDDWAEIGMALEEGKEWEVRFDKPDYGFYRRDGYIVVDIDGKSYRSDKSDYLEDCAEMEAVKALLDEIAPLQPEFSGPRF